MGKKVNLVLGGGGAKGFAHVGVLEALAEKRIEIKSIFGTSVGGMIGGLFAYFRAYELSKEDPLEAQIKAAKKLHDVCVVIDFSQFKDWNLFGLAKSYVIKGKNLEAWLKTRLSSKEYSEGIKFSELKFDLSIIATSARDGRAIVYNAKDFPTVFIHEAIRASASIQFVFHEKKLTGYNDQQITCWDGGNVGNCRFDLPLKKFPGEQTVASSLTYRGEEIRLKSTFLGVFQRPVKLALQTIDIMLLHMEENVRTSLSNTELQNLILIQPQYGDVQTTDFGLSPKEKEILIASGRSAMEANISKLL